MVFDLIAAALFALGIFFTFTGTLGIIRFPTFFSKVHAAGVTDSLGAPLLLLGCAIKYGLCVNALKIVLLIAVIWVTSTTAIYIICKAKLKEKDHDHSS